MAEELAEGDLGSGPLHARCVVKCALGRLLLRPPFTPPSIRLPAPPDPFSVHLYLTIPPPWACACAELKASEVKLAAEVKSLIAKNQVENAKRIVVQVCRVRKGIERQAATHAMLNSLVLQLGEQQGALPRWALSATAQLLPRLPPPYPVPPRPFLPPPH